MIGMERAAGSEWEQLLASSAKRDQLTGSGATFLLEQKLKAHYGKSHCIVTSNATTALLATGLAAGLRGREIITSPLNWGGSVAPFALLGNTFSVGAVDPDRLNLDWHSLKYAVSKPTAAMLVNDQFGTAHDQYEMRRECDRYGLLYISDSACSLGAFDGDGTPAGSRADVVITSFVSGKGISAGEGGAILTDDDALYERLIMICTHPERQRKEHGSHNEFTPLNARLHPIAAELLINTWDLQMERLNVHQERCYDAIRSAEERVSPLTFPTANTSTYFDLWLHCRAADGLKNLPKRTLSFLHEKPQLAHSPVQFRLAKKVAHVLDMIRNEHYVELNALREAR